MKKLGMFVLVAFCCVAVFGASNSGAYQIPYNIGTIEDFLANGTYFNGGATTVGAKTFTGMWEYTALASEAGNVNITDEGGTPTFSVANLSNWGSWESVNFGPNTNIYFQDANDGPRIAFNPYSPNTTNFKLFQLAGNSNALGYLANPLILSQGTYIIGWNDNTATGQSNDGDYDDIIIAIRPVPEPTTMLLLGLGLVGLAGLRRKL